ncbi:hypothetical protein Halru_3072 [Halovivax ruber XH-70]|uniref:Phosphoribosyl-ATP pyrophosphohydrolase n=1 Tax=Halovivax ruber (strain DSM 18193 / JCM 13892 / XH-70) TaxID=797302 RepID=L0IFL5_HALRX|nr:nucleoside triphosphate pyrophosphohydrolase [Halovivax ruber]AGB17638.1 hypothetical protein Halru_3072 [Halovivax ruber XH-70]
MADVYDKLVRDEIPAIIEADGDEPTIHRADDAAYRERLADKLDEEVTEFLESRDVEELVDIVEVVHAIRRARGVSLEEFQEKRTRKADRRGRFEERIVLERVERS